MSTIQHEKTKVTEPVQKSLSRAQSGTVIAGMIDRLTGLAVKREAWETSEYERSNQGLYLLVGECLELYRDLTHGETAKLLKQGLNDYINLKGYTFKDSSSLSMKVIRCVFGDRDRRRLSTYHTVLRVAIAEKWAPEDVPKLITAQGGVQEISLRKPGGITLKERAKAAEAALMDQSIANLSSESILREFNTEHIGDRAVALLTLNADGSYSVHCLVRAKSAVTAALAGYFSSHREILKDLQEQQRREAAEEERARLIAESAVAANDALTSITA